MMGVYTIIGLSFAPNIFEYYQVIYVREKSCIYNIPTDLDRVATPLDKGPTDAVLGRCRRNHPNHHHHRVP